MARTDNLNHFLTDVADAIRAKTGDGDPINAADFDDEIINIPTGGVVSETGTFTPTTATSELTITFTNTYSVCPKYLIIENATGNPPQTTAYTIQRLLFVYAPGLQGIYGGVAVTENIHNFGSVTGISCRSGYTNSQSINTALLYNISTEVPSEATANQKKGYTQYYFPLTNYAVDRFHIKMSDIMPSNSPSFEANTEYKWTAVW